MTLSTVSRVQPTKNSIKNIASNLSSFDEQTYHLLTRIWSVGYEYNWSQKKTTDQISVKRW